MQRSALLFGITLLGIISCAPSAPSTPGASTGGQTAPAATAAPAITRGGSLTAGMWLDVASLDPIKGDALATDRYWYNLLYDQLITLDSKGKPQPELAQSVDLSPDGKVVTMKLRPGVTFHDGTALDSAAVKLSIERVRDEKNNSRDRTKYALLDAIETPDASTVIVRFKSFSALGLEALASQAGMPVSPAAVAKSGDQFGRNPVGTGPFTFVEWVSNDHVTLKRNPNYWKKAPDGQSLPYLDQVTIRAIPSDSQRLIELRSNNMQLDSRLPARDIATLEKNPEFKVQDKPTTDVYFVAVNVKAGPLGNQKVREAVAHALNRDEMNKALFFGRGYVTPSVWNKDEWTYDPTIKQFPFDVAKAKSLLAEAGYANGLKTKIVIVQRDPDTQIAQVIQQQLKAVGIDLEIEGVERTAFLDRMNSGSDDYGMGLSFNAQPQGEPAGRIAGLLNGSYTNKTYPESKELMDKVAILPDPTERKAIYTQLTKLFTEDATRLYLVQTPQVIGHTAKLSGVKMEPFGPWILTEAWLAR